MELAILVNMVGVEVKEILESVFETLICAVSEVRDLAYTQPMKSTRVAPVRLISPVAAFSMLYSSVVAATATTDQPLAVSKTLSLTCGECPLPYPEPPEPI